jgi:hypothetical protein
MDSEGVESPTEDNPRPLQIPMGIGLSNAGWVLEHATITIVFFAG